MAKRRESLDEKQPHAGLGRHDRETDDEPRTARPGVTSGARARGLRGQHVVDAYAPNATESARYRTGEAAAPEGEVRPQDLPARRGRAQPTYTPEGEVHEHE